MQQMSQPQARAHWVMKVLEVQFEPASPLTGEVFDILIDQVCAAVLSPEVGPALGLPTWRERRDASRTLYACALAGHIPGSPEGAGRTAHHLRVCAQELSEITSSVAPLRALQDCAAKLESYSLAFSKTRQHAYSDELQRARRVTRIERELMSSLLEFIEALAPHGRR